MNSSQKNMLLFFSCMIFAISIAYISYKYDKVQDFKEESELNDVLEQMNEEIRDDIFINGISIVNQGELRFEVISKWGDKYETDYVKKYSFEEEILYPYIKYKVINKDTRKLKKGSHVIHELVIPFNYRDKFGNLELKE